MAEVNLVVARALLAGGVELHNESPVEVDVEAGQEVLVKFPYRFSDTRREREDYVVSLTTQLDDEPSQTETVTSTDHRMRSDDKRGFVMRRHTVLAAGTHTLHFRAAIRLDMADWDDGQEREVAREVEGQVTLHVQ